MTMKYGDVVTKEMNTVSQRVAALAFAANSTQTAHNPPKSFRNGGRYRIRTYDFHRVKMALYR